MSITPGKDEFFFFENPCIVSHCTQNLNSSQDLDLPPNILPASLHPAPQPCPGLQIIPLKSSASPGAVGCPEHPRLDLVMAPSDRPPTTQSTAGCFSPPQSSSDSRCLSPWAGQLQGGWDLILILACSIVCLKGQGQV
jgi:hypothetical protein